MLASATGSGKSSTINALFNMEVAKVGVGVDPETNTISKFSLDNLVIWDTTGLGDGVENDEKITRNIITKLNEMDSEGKPLIDMVVVILDASPKDLGTLYDLINKVLIPCLGDEAKDRILIALNQSDIAMKGTHWDVEKNEPDEILKEYLKKKAASVQKRIKEGTGLDIKPICYCAGYKEEGGEQRRPYNLTKLLYYIVKAIPRDKRLASCLIILYRHTIVHLL
ncbi:MAG: GTPase [Lachnospiraceae bacterium]